VGGTSADWERVAEDLDTRIRLVALDRPGMGRSERGAPPDVAGSIRRLETILDALGTAPPVVLAGWSMGALLAIGVALERPDLVSGLVLVDPSHPEEARRFADPALHPLGRGMWHVVGFASRLGGAAIAGIPSRVLYLRMSRGEVDEPRWQMPSFATARAGQALASEMLAFPALCDEVGSLRAAAVDGAGRAEQSVLPCSLLSASRRRDDIEADHWAEMHDDLATWFPGTEVSVVAGSGHDMLSDRPDVVAEAIARTVAESTG
ncbi:MAG: alpha/beta fold hydrolase, partial [Actinobacteria bacterium]|nr:alpha/beta fold hydrolase [Actinomycetota bacterium]